MTSHRDRTGEREQMVRRQLIGRGVTDPRVLEAFRAVPRELFVSGALASHAYEDRPLPIGDEQTISQPYIVAVTLSALALTGTERVLEIGTGSGYSAALLTHLASEVYSVERLSSLAQAARSRLAAFGYRVHVKEGDGTLGWPDHAPFDAIAVAASGPRLPDALVAQLSPGGRMVIPLRREGKQMLVRVVRERGDSVRTDPIEEVSFVPLIGAQGEPDVS